MNVFISNDDGIKSLGLKAIAEKMAQKHNVLVIAPDGNRSAVSHSLSIRNSIIVNKVKAKNYDAYSISGTPADCVKFAKIMFSDFNIDVVIAGINRGHNLGSDILYSGTVAIACEASFFEHVSFAFSSYNLMCADYDLFAVFAEKIIEELLPISEKGDIWNVNFPDNDKEIKGIKFTPLGRHIYSDRYEKIGENEYKLVGQPQLNDNIDEDCDISWGEKGYITITPILFNKTNYEKLNKVKEKCEKLL